ncbi:tagaturonate reductase [Spirosoma pollinicola]|uniref:Altronate oxidoreductase n=1 Tax=Spirosoma pollinicola TaxID=2057025 RepID=A0A2K8YVF1_9BACT|nr:tagaturonate reductase [Spirosoma pollinicola]AUD01548.1 altronate oxidoreductase [Spirosoma pollinicola]
MQSLSTQSLPYIQSGIPLGLPVENWQQLPERVLQFGTGVLLRGLPDYLIDKANRQGIFNGRIVVIKSTDGGDMNAFARQDNLYTLCIRGIQDGQTVEENVVCSAISRVLSAKQQWDDILRVAISPDLQIVISNTTEVGIQLVQDDVRQSPPESFPGKLLAVLYARYQAFNGASDKGLVIVPTELISDNATKLEAILLELAHRNELDGAFIDWLETANTYCNSLVDRIVPGRPDSATQQELTGQLGYEDELLTISEVYRLWAIQGNEQVKNILSFHQADDCIFIRPNIDLFRELKLRLLNGTHTLSCGLAYLGGFNTVRAAMEDEVLSTFISRVMLDELIPGIPYAVDPADAERFGSQVLDRFRNSFIEHRWLGITMQYTAKMQMRNVQTLLHYYQQFGTDQPVTPAYFSLGFAAYLLFMRGTKQQGDTWYGERNGEVYPINDAQAPYFADLWATLTPAELTHTVLANTTLWGHDLSKLPGFADSVSGNLSQLLETGVLATLATQLDTGTIV